MQTFYEFLFANEHPTLKQTALARLTRARLETMKALKSGRSWSQWG